MACKTFIKKRENLLWAFLLLLVVLLVSSVRYDYYFDLNDDVLMKDILAGVYTGEPEGHNIQMLWLISAAISLFYRIAPALPWYGLFLCGCHYLSIGLVVHRSLVVYDRNRERQLCGCNANEAELLLESGSGKNASGKNSIAGAWTCKLLLLLAELVFCLAFLMPHIVCAQYTVTCSMLAAAAAFLFLTTENGLSAKDFIRRNIGTVLLVLLAYLIRSEMLELLLPLICVAGVCKWSAEEQIFEKENVQKYLSIIGLILLSLVIGQGTHQIAYGSDAWQKFTEFFDNRTELYDFQVLPEYEGNETFYTSIGLTENERELLENYNFGLDEEIDEDLLLAVADYAAENRSAETPFLTRLLTSLKSYYRRTVYPPSQNESDFPWNYAVLLGYLAVLLMHAVTLSEQNLRQRLLTGICRLGFLGIVRSVLWVWLIMRDRVPVRISHSMYFMELCILLGIGMMLMENACGTEPQQEALQQKEELQSQKWQHESVGDACCKNTGKKAIAGIFVATVCLSIWALPLQVRALDADVEAKAERNESYDALYTYLRSQPDAFYFIDVYSSVGYTEKMFVDVDNTLANYDIMGGWACKSPLQEEKLTAFDLSNMEEALLQDNVYYVQERGTDTTWLVDYYADHGKAVSLSLTEETAGFEIYRLTVQSQ